MVDSISLTGTDIDILLPFSLRTIQIGLFKNLINLLLTAVPKVHSNYIKYGKMFALK